MIEHPNFECWSSLNRNGQNISLDKNDFARDIPAESVIVERNKISRSPDATFSGSCHFCLTGPFAGKTIAFLNSVMLVEKDVLAAGLVEDAVVVTRAGTR